MAGHEPDQCRLGNAQGDPPFIPFEPGVSRNGFVMVAQLVVESALMNLSWLRRLDVVLITVLLLIYPIWSITQGQDVSYDARNYHLYSSLAFLSGAYEGDLLPGGTQTFLNPLASLPAAFLFYGSRLFGPMLPTLAFSLLQGLALAVVYFIGLKLLNGDRPLAFLAALFGGSAPMVLSEVGSTMADLTLALLIMLSVAVAIGAAMSDSLARRHQRLALAAGLLGACVGMKLTFLTAVPLLIAVGLLGPSSPSRDRIWLRELLADAAVSLLAFLLSLIVFAAPQVLTANHFTGNPVFPLFNHYFRSPLHEDVQPSEERFLPDSPGSFLMAPLHDFTDSFNAPFNKDADLQTRRSEVLFRDLRTVLWFAGSALLLFIPAWRQQMGRLRLSLIAGLLASYWLWLFLTAIGRYSIGLQLLQGLVVAMTCQSILPNHDRRVRALMASLLTLGLVTQITPSWGRAGFETHWSNVRLAADTTQPAVVPVEKGRLQFRPKEPLVLLNRPIGWIKSHSLTSGNPLLLWNPGIAPRSVGHSKLASVQARIEKQVLASRVDTFLVVSLSASSTEVNNDLKVFLAEAPSLKAAGFQPGSCSSYEHINGSQKFSVCTISRRLKP